MTQPTTVPSFHTASSPSASASVASTTKETRWRFGAGIFRAERFAQRARLRERLGGGARVVHRRHQSRPQAPGGGEREALCALKARRVLLSHGDAGGAGLVVPDASALRAVEARLHYIRDDDKTKYFPMTFGLTF